MGKTTIWKKTDRDLYELLDQGCYEEMLENSETNQDDLLVKWTEQNISDLRSSLKLGNAILQDFARKTAGDAKAYAVLKTGALMGTVECFEHILYENAKNEQVEKSMGQEIRTVKHLSAIIHALETHGVMTHTELAENLKMNTSTLTEAMKKIIATGAVNAASAGKYKLYSLTDKGIRLGRQIRRKKSENDDIEQAIKIVQEYLEYSEHQGRELHEILHVLTRKESRILHPGEKLVVYNSSDKKHVYDKYMVQGVLRDSNDSNAENENTISVIAKRLSIESENNRYGKEAG